MTRKEWMMENCPAWVADCYTGGVCGCPKYYPSLVEIDPTIKDEDTIPCDGDHGEVCKVCWNKEIPHTKKEKTMEDKRLYNEHLEKASGCGTVNDGRPRILDSGNRREFESGAVRDIQEGKGRCDLLPLYVVGNLFFDPFFNHINNFQDDGDVASLYRVIDLFSVHWLGENETVEEHDYIKTAGYAEMCLEVAKHFEDGCKKYGENNWRKGIPVHCYIDSAVRHYLKFLATWEDEPHDRAVVWNLMCAIWTCDHMPELNEYKKETK